MTVVERYRRALASLGTDTDPLTPGAEDVSPLVRSVSWSDSVDPPWQSVTVRMSGRSITQPPFDIGDHVVLRNAPGIPACAWAIVVNVSRSLRKTESGTSEQGEWSIQAVGWLDYLGRVDLITYLTILTNPNSVDAAGVKTGDRIAVGTIFGSNTGTTGTDDAAQLFDETALGLFNGVGISLAKFIHTALRIELPPALAASGVATYLRDAVRVCYDQVTMDAVGDAGVADRAGNPARAIEPIIGFQPSPQPLSNGSTKLGGYIQGTWGVDPGVGELFPSLEDPSFARTVQSSMVGPWKSSTTDGLVLGDVLQRSPVLIYRMRPWRAEPLKSWIARIPELVQLQQWTLEILNTPEYASFGGVTWDISRAAVVGQDDLMGMDEAYSDDDACTVTSSLISGSLTPDAFASSVGLPIVCAITEQYGARLYTVSWPFGRNSDSVGGEIKAAVTQMVCIMAAQGSQWHIAADRFARGTIQLRFRPDIRHGEPVLVRLATGVFVAYCDSVRHSVDVADKTITRRTTVNYSRGTWNEAERAFPKLQRPQSGDFDIRGAV